MESFITEFFKKEKIKYYSCLPISDCKLLYPAKLPDFTNTVCFFLIPYNIKNEPKNNISVYSIPRDYHYYIKELNIRFGEAIKAAGITAEYRFFADNSPFCERTNAEKCGIGKVGKNGLLINSEYGSFVFIGSLCLSLSISITQTPQNFKGDICGNCEKCKTYCPMLRKKCSECLSAITQKKRITDDEAALIAQAPIKWGCDICQKICPYNENAVETPIEFFRVERIPYLTKELLCSMSDEQFFQRAYSWRGKAVIERNIELNAK